jgi:2-polyprenyl-3-methyl-5-hydroxy-6-metoxy-1,4-benzoquinol methylase
MTINHDGEAEPKTTLQTMEVHAVWTSQFRTAENERFYGLAFDYIARCFGPPAGNLVLDVGCGSAVKSVHLARRGYRVLGLDFSAAILTHARATAEAAGVSGLVQLQQGDLTGLEFGDGRFRQIVCWGVLMHIPAVEKAISELARVLEPGGTLIVSEGNCRSLQAVALRWLKRLLRRERADVLHTPFGIEFWEDTQSGRLMTRQADIRRLVAEFERHGLKLARRRAGQFTEIYTLFPWRWQRRIVHAFNHAWFRCVRRGGPAFGNLLVFIRPSKV